MTVRTRQLLVIIVAGLLGLGGGYFVRQHRSNTAPPVASALPPNGDASIGVAPLPDPGPLKDLSGQEYRLSHWKGKLVLMNFWASWCVPCKHEIPTLIAAQNKYAARGLQVVGIAVDDLDPAREAATRLGINYPVLQGSPDVLIPLMTDLGNDQGGLPFSAWVNADGQVFDRTLGEIDTSELDRQVTEHLPKSVL